MSWTRMLHCLYAALLFLGWALPAAADPVRVPFTLIEPVQETVAQAGAGLPVAVAVGPDSGIRRVSYYWYRYDEEPVSPQLAHPSLVADAASTPPYGGQVAVPVDAIGTMRLLAVAEIAQGRLGSTSEFDECLIQVTTPAVLSTIEFSVEKPWVLTPVGKLAQLPIVGFFGDEIMRRLDGPLSGTRVRSSDEEVVQILEGGFVRARKSGRAVLEVENRGQTARLDVAVVGEPGANQVPRAHPGGDQTVKGGTRVSLRGVASADPDGDPLRYEWTQVRGAKVDLVGSNEPIASFVAPKVSVRRLLQFKLQVTDMVGPDTVKGADSLPAYVNVWVEP